MKRILLFSCLALFGLTSCNRLDVAFRWADVYIASKVDDLFNINSSQKKELKKSIQKDLRHVQATLLPSWIESLDEIDKQVGSGLLDDQKVAKIFSSIMSDVDKLKSFFVDTAVNFVASTDSQQMIYFSKAYKKKNQEEMEKALDVQKLRRKYRDKYEDYFEMFLGPLTSRQEVLLEQHLQRASFPAVLKVKNNEMIFEKFISQILDRKAVEEFVKELYTNPEKLDLPEYRQAYLQYQKSLQKLISEVMLSMTPEQKKILRRRIAEKKAQLARVNI